MNMIMTEQPQVMPPQSPIVHQQSYGQQQTQWGMNQQQPQQQSQAQYNQQVQFNQQSRITQNHSQTNSLSNPPTPHQPIQQMPPPNMIQQQIQPPPQSPQLGQINPSVNPGILQRNQIQQGHNPNFQAMNQQQFMNSQQHQQFQMGNQLPQQQHQNPSQFQQQTSHHPHSNMIQQPPPPILPPQVINLPLHLQPEYRIYEMNKRLSNRPDQLLFPVTHQHFDPNISYMWYESFVNEFFDENAKLAIRNFTDENGNCKNFTLSRSLIPRFFRSFSDGGCMDLNFQIQRGQIINIQTINSQNTPNGSHQQQLIVYESDSCIMNCKLGRPMYAKICTEGNLVLECVLEPSLQQPPGSNHLIFDSIKIRNFSFFIKRHQELIPRSAVCILQEPNQALIDQLSTNITRMGLIQQTIKYLKICSVLEPMQELMLKNKITGLPPRECLRNCAVQRFNNSRNIQHQQQPPPPQPMPTTPTTPQINSPFQRNPSLIQNDETVNKPVDNGKPNTSNQPVASDNSRTPSKRRKRKPSPNPNPNEIKKEPGPPSKSKKGAAAAATAAAATQQHQASQPVFNYQGGYMPHMQTGQMGDVMVVGEPSLMGGDFGEEDERLITRLENNQYDTMNLNLMGHQIPNHIKQTHFMPQPPMNIQRVNSYPQQQPQIHHHQQIQPPQQLLDDSKQLPMMSPSPIGNIQPPTRPPSSLPPSMPPRPQSTSHFINTNPNQPMVDQSQTRSMTPSPSTSNLISSLAPKTPTPHPPPSLTPQQTNQMIDLNLNGLNGNSNLITTSNASSSSSKSPLNNSLTNGIVAQQQTQQPPSTSTSSSAIASSSSSLSPNSVFNSSNNNVTNNSSNTAIMSPGQYGSGNGKPAQLSNDQSQQNQQQKSIFL